VPIIDLTRCGDLKTKLAAFDQGVDDVMTVPFSPEEFLARALVFTQRACGGAPHLQPVIRVAEIEIDILNRPTRLPLRAPRPLPRVRKRRHQRQPASRIEARVRAQLQRPSLRSNFPAQSVATIAEAVGIWPSC
jgi:CheY-like chemotaxis protein